DQLGGPRAAAGCTTASRRLEAASRALAGHAAGGEQQCTDRTAPSTEMECHDTSSCGKAATDVFAGGAPFPADGLLFTLANIGHSVRDGGARRAVGDGREKSF